MSAHAEIGAAELLEWQARGARVVDVREEFELLNGVIPGAESLPLSRFLDGVDGLAGVPVVFVCASGSRSRDAAAYLARQGFEHEVANFSGGMKGWREEGREVAPWRPPADRAEPPTEADG